jgi:hypothetical protein
MTPTSVHLRQEMWWDFGQLTLLILTVAHHFYMVLYLPDKTIQLFAGLNILNASIFLPWRSSP